MNLTSLTAAVLIVPVVLALASCQSTAQPPQEGAAPSPCRPDAAEALVGRARISDAEARQATGASLVRQIGPGQPVTMDHRRERVTIETDPKTGKIVRASCG